MEVAAAHFDDRAKTAIEGAAARGLDHIHLPAQQRVSLEHARGALWQADFLIFEPVRRPRGIVHPTIAIVPRQAPDLVDPGALFQRAQQLAEGNFALAAHQIIDAHVLVSLGRETGIVSADHDFHSRAKRAHQVDNAARSSALKRHDGESDDLRLKFVERVGRQFREPGGEPESDQPPPRGDANLCSPPAT